MKLIRTNTSRLDLSWSAQTPTARSLHALLGTVLVAADCAKVADADVMLDRGDDRSTISFRVDVPGGAATLPRKPAMAAWNPKSLADAGIESLATETVTLSYAIHGSSTFADQMAAFAQVQADTAAAGYTTDPAAIRHHTSDGFTTMSVSFSESVLGSELASLADSKLRALPQSDTDDSDSTAVSDTPSVEAPAAPAAKAKRAKTTPASVAAEATVPAQPSAPEPVADVVPTADPAPAPAVAAEPADEAAAEPQPTPEHAQVAQDEDAAAPATAAPETVVAAVEPAQVVDTPPAPLTVVPALPTAEGDFDLPEPPDFESYPPEFDAPEPQVPDAPPMPEFDVNALIEPPTETTSRRRPPAAAAPSTPASRAKAHSGAPAPSADGKIWINEEDIF